MNRPPNIRSIVDEITLAIAEADQTAIDLQAAISDQAVAHIKRMVDEGSLRSDADLDRVTYAVVQGVLKRLLQIAESGGQIGRA